MGIKKIAPVALWFMCAAPAYAQSTERQVWITIGTDALESARAAFAEAGWELPTPAQEKDGVAVLSIGESQVETLAKGMHDKLNRCAGFIAHDSNEGALKAMEMATAPRGPSTQIAYTLDNATVVNSLLGGLQETNIRSTITSLSSYANRRYNTQAGADSATWLKNQWTSMASGRSDVSVAFFTHSGTGWLQPSVIATIQGTTLPGEIVVIGGHLDSINGSSTTANAPGADDDASGIATLTEVFRTALAQGYRPARTVKFMAYAAEEVGLKGSAAIASAHKTSGANVVGVLQLDMVNYRGSSVDVGMVTDYTNAAQNTFITNLIGTYLPGVTWANTSCGYGCSDHASWNSQGYPASIPFESLVSQDNPYIHTANDTLANMNGGTASHALKFAKIGAAFMAELAKGDMGTPPVTVPVVTATFDATLKAPKCATTGSGCDSGTLLNGRAGLGPEVNKPNTINASCADGIGGAYHTDESNDRLKVSTTDGTKLAPGKSVRIDATVWAYSTTADKLDLYYAANANSPTWTFLTTLAPTATGARTLSATYTLPSGTLQAVRARFRYQGTAGACGTGSYDDHDDLIFAVQ
jgi:leucyl aminopeptidase